MDQKEKLSRAPSVAMLAVSLTLVVAIAVAVYQNSRQREAANQQSQISQNLHDDTGELLSLLKDAETGQRGYLLTGRGKYLEPYHQAISAIPGVVKQLETYTMDRPDQAERLNELKPVIAAKLSELEETVKLRQTQGVTPALEVVDSDRGKALMDDIRARCAAIRDVASQRSDSYLATAEASARRLRLISTAGSAILFVFLALSAWSMLAGMARREKLYNEAHASAELLQVTLASIGDGVLVTDAAARITFINPVGQQLTGWPLEEARGTHIGQVFRVVHETTRAPLDNPLEKALATGAIVGLANHAVLIAKNGTEIPVDDSGAPIRDKRGLVHGAVLVFRDISARRHTELQLKASNEQLKEFVGAAAHDLRSPLNSVTNMAEALALRFHENLGDEGNELLGYIIKGATRMRRLLEDLLAYAQASHFEMVEDERTAMDKALEKVLENLRSDIENTRAVVTAGPLPVVAASETHVVQLLQNLIGNALKYRSEATPDVRIASDRTNTECVIRVSDNGIGIEAQYAKEIFKPFKRLHGEDRPGSGIGLATCQKIVSGYGGRIWMESQPGKGSTFYISLPPAEAAAANGAALGKEAS